MSEEEEDGRRLADMIGHLPRPKTRSMFGVVTQVAPLLVHPEGAKAGTVIGPVALVRNAPKVGDQVPMIQLPEQSMWIAIGPLATADLTLVYVNQVNNGVMYRRGAGAVWTDPVLVPGSLGSFSDYGVTAAPDAANEGIAAMTEPSTVTVAADVGINWTETRDTNRIFRLSDGSVVVIGGTAVGSGSLLTTRAIRRAPGGTWQTPVGFGDAPPIYAAASVWCRNGDTLYGLLWRTNGTQYSGDMVPARVDLVAGALVTSTGAALNGFFASGHPRNDTIVDVLYVPERNVLVCMYLTVTNYVDFFGNTIYDLITVPVDPATLGAFATYAYNVNFAGPLLPNVIGAQGRMLDLGAGVVLVLWTTPRSVSGNPSTTPVLNAWTMTADAGGTTTTAMENPPAPPALLDHLLAVRDTAGVVTVVGSHTSYGGVWTIQRSPAGTWDAAWAQIATQGFGTWGALSASGAATRVAWVRDSASALIETVIP